MWRWEQCRIPLVFVDVKGLCVISIFLFALVLRAEYETGSLEILERRPWQCVCVSENF